MQATPGERGSALSADNAGNEERVVGRGSRKTQGSIRAKFYLRRLGSIRPENAPSRSPDLPPFIVRANHRARLRLRCSPAKKSRCVQSYVGQVGGFLALHPWG
jgi:hypothetical protein